MARRPILVDALLLASLSAKAGNDFVHFDAPQRSLRPCPGAATVFDEMEPGDDKARLSAQACRKFIDALGQVTQQLPRTARPLFVGFRFFLMLGEKSALGGRGDGRGGVVAALRR